MLKKIKLFIMFVIITTTLVSCVNVDFHLNVKNSSQSEIEIVVKYDKNYSYINNNIDSILYYLKDKYEIEKINNGYKLKTKLNLEKISSNSTIILPITNFSYEIKNYFLWKSIIIKSNFSINDLKNYYNNELFNNLIKYIPDEVYNKINLRFILDLPIKITQTNAQIIQNKGKTAIWSLSLKANNYLYLKQNIPNLTNIILLSIILIVLLLLVFKLNQHKNQHKNY